MPTNSFFNNFSCNTEQSLIEDLIVESIEIYGIDVYYLPRTLSAEDKILNEDDLSTFDSAYEIEMYLKNVDGFEGEGDFLSKFGLQIRDSMTLSMSRKSFNTIIGANTSLTRPNEGDLIWFPFNSKIFEIMHVEHEAVFYQLGSLQFYDLRVELFEYSGERFNTGVTAIDNRYTSYDMTSNTALANVETTDSFADNSGLQSEANTVIDYTENNPFGDDRY